MPELTFPPLGVVLKNKGPRNPDVVLPIVPFALPLFPVFGISTENLPTGLEELPEEVELTPGKKNEVKFF